MSGIPKDIPNFAPADAQPRQNPAFSPGPDFTTEDYFVWSRCDGNASLREIILMVGLDYDKTIEILRKLRQCGAIALDGEEPEAVEERAASLVDNGVGEFGVLIAPGISEDGLPSDDLPPGDEHSLDDNLTEEEEAALAEQVAIGAAEKRRILAVLRTVRYGDFFQLLGIERGTERREIKRAYYRVSKEFHPDRHFGRELGSFGPRLSAIFQTITRAFQVLHDPRSRAEYEAKLDGAEQPSQSSGPQSKEDYAAELFGRACQAELAADTDEALRFFAAAIRVDGQPRYLRRAAMCALAAGELSVAEEYAKKAADLCPSDASYLRVLADVFRHAGRLSEAEEALLRALKLRTENDVLVGELRADLATVQKELQRSKS